MFFQKNYRFLERVVSLSMTIGCQNLRCGLLFLGGILGAHCAAASGKPAGRPPAQAPADTFPEPVQRYHQNGRVAERCRLVNGQFEGARVLYYPSGRVQSAMRFRAGRAVGPARTYDRHGRLTREMSFVDGLLDGTWTGYEHGAKFLQAAYQHGEIDGPYTRFYPNGAVQVQAQFQQGRLVSTVRVWTKKGRLVAEELPDATGKWPITRITYDKAGRPKRSETLDITLNIHGDGDTPRILGGP